MLLGRREYFRKPLLLRPITYWPLWETSGATAYDIAGSQRNGSHTAVTLVQPGIGDWRTCPLYDGATSYTDIYSASLNAAFTGSAFTLAIWGRVSAAGVWTDGTWDTAMHLYVDGNNEVVLRKQNAANTFGFELRGGGVLKVVNHVTSTVDWFHAAITVDESAGINGEMKAYWNGAQTGATQTALGAWAGVLNANICLVGAHNKTPALVWSGRLAHSMIFTGALTAAQVQALYWYWSRI